MRVRERVIATDGRAATIDISSHLIRATLACFHSENEKERKKRNAWEFDEITTTKIINVLSLFLLSFFLLSFFSPLSFSFSFFSPFLSLFLDEAIRTLAIAKRTLLFVLFFDQTRAKKEEKRRRKKEYCEKGREKKVKKRKERKKEKRKKERNEERKKERKKERKIFEK